MIRKRGTGVSFVHSRRSGYGFSIIFWHCLWGVNCFLDLSLVDHIPMRWGISLVRNNTTNDLILVRSLACSFVLSSPLFLISLLPFIIVVRSCKCSYWQAWFIVRCTYFLPSEMESDHANWPLARDHALVLYVDTLCRAWSTTPSRLMPDELLLSEVDLTSEDFHLLQGELTDLLDSS